MAKISLTDTKSGYDLSSINSNFQKIQQELQDKVLYRDNPTGEPNQLEGPLDFNGSRALNTPSPIYPTDLVRLKDISGEGYEPGDVIINLNGIQPYTLQEAVSRPDAELGQVVQITDRGNAQFKYIEATTANGYNLIEATASGLTLELIVTIVTNPIAFGAVPAVSTEFDSYGALAACNTSGASVIMYPKERFYSSATVPFESAKSYQGFFDESIIYSDTDNIPVGASSSYINNTSPSGSSAITGLTFIGEKANAGQKGFVLFDYYSLLDKVSVFNCGGGGIQLSHEDSSGQAPSGTLVENRVTAPVIRNCGGTLLDLGESDNNKLTDGYCTNPILDGEVGLTVQHLSCGSSAGWRIEGLHAYGSASDVTINLENANNTRLTDFFIEAFIDRAVSAPKAQGDLIISGHINANEAVNGSRAVVVAKSSVVDNISADIDVAVSLDVPTDGITVLYNDSLEGDIRAKLRAQGSDGYRLKKVDGTNQARIDVVKINDGCKVYGSLVDNENLSTQVSLEHDSLRLGYAFLSPRLRGDSSQTVNVPIKLRSFGKLLGDIRVRANAFDNGGPTASWKADIFVSAKTNGVDEWSVIVDEVSAPTGMSSPTVTVSNTSGDEGVITITFSFNTASATGVCKVSL